MRGIRSKRPDLPVVIVTGACMVEERVRGLEAGADDYVAKPFAFAELAARIRAVLRRGTRPACSILQIEDLQVDRISHTVRRGSRNIDLSPKEFALLEFLMRHGGQPVPRAVIVEQVWKLDFDTTSNVVDVYDSRRRLPDWRKRPAGQGGRLEVVPHSAEKKSVEKYGRRKLRRQANVNYVGAALQSFPQWKKKPTASAADRTKSTIDV